MADREPEWNAVNMNRKRGETTFKQCGWCIHAGSGSFRYGCMLDGKCNLLPDYKNDEKQFDSPCSVITLAEGDIRSLIDHKKYKNKERRDSIKRAMAEISILQTLKKKAPKKPCLPENRKADHFKLKEAVWTFDIETEKWKRGVIVSGYRSGDGCVSFVLDGIPESNKGWGCGVGGPWVMLESEFMYFKKNPKDFKLWLELCKREYNGKDLDVTTMLSAFEEVKNV